MLEKLNKFAIYIVLGLFGYLTHTIVDVTAAVETEQDVLPVITKTMLNPVLIEPYDRASKADRDPFEVNWDTYFKGSDIGRMLDETEHYEISESEGPVLNSKLRAIISDSSGQKVALIGEYVCRPGSLVGPDDPNLCWTVESILDDRVRLTYGKLKRLMVFGQVPADGNIENTDEAVNERTDIEPDGRTLQEMP